MQLCIFEDTHYSNFQPLVYFRPVYDLRCGISSLCQKITALFPRATVVLHVRKELEEYTRESHPTLLINQLAGDDTWFINGRIIADHQFERTLRSHDCKTERLFCNHNGIGAVFVKGENISRITQHLGQPFSEAIFQNIPSKETPFKTVRYLWDIIHATAGEIEIDIRRFGKNLKKRTTTAEIYPGAHLVNKKNIFIGNGSIIKPGAVLDAEQGPIVIGKNVTIMPNAVIEGPAYIGDHTIIKVGAKIYHGTSIGEHCKVGGEIEASIIQSYTNKQHDGFLGHSYLGSWVNIGADTNTSDLKNTYGSVKVEHDGTVIDTGMQFVGLMMGDHSKTGINVMFDTGTVVGVSSNIYGAGLPSKFIPSFSWGEKESLTTYHLEKSLETARRVFARRDVVMTEAYETLFRHVYHVTEESRKKTGVV